MRDAPDEFETLFRNDYARLIRGLGSFGDGAEEAVQEAFVKALVRWSHVGKLEDPAGWVRRVAVRSMSSSAPGSSSTAISTGSDTTATYESAGGKGPKKPTILMILPSEASSP